MAYPDADDKAEALSRPLWKVCFGDKIPWGERVDEVVFSLTVRFRNGLSSRYFLVNPKNTKIRNVKHFYTFLRNLKKYIIRIYQC